MAIYKPEDCRPFSEITEADRLSNQITISGTDDTYLMPKGVFLLELLIIESGKTVTIKDGNGNTIGTGITSFQQEHVPLRCDRGITFVGDVALAKGSAIQDMFEEL